MTYLPDGIYHQMRRACEEAGVQLITKPGTKLKDLLCAFNKTHHDPSLKPVVYKINCPCTDKATYVGQTIRPVAAANTAKLRKEAIGNTLVLLNTKRRAMRPSIGLPRRSRTTPTKIRTN